MKKTSLLIIIAAVVALYFVFKGKGSTGSGLINMTGVGTLPTSALTSLLSLPAPGIGPLLSPIAPINNQTPQNTAPPEIPDPSLLAFTIPSIASTPVPILTTAGDLANGAYPRTPTILDAPPATPPGVFYD
jgi:hypothetical protein